MQFFVIRCNSVNTLENLVNGHLAEGWQLFGSLQVNYLGYDDLDSLGFIYHQCMTKETAKDTAKDTAKATTNETAKEITKATVKESVAM